nr:MAG TPA: Minor capsid protein [Caudoviricetes sp.]
MTAADSIFRLYGEDISVGTATGKGFISCLDADNAQIHRQPLAAGVKNGSKYRLITNMGNIAEGARVQVSGRIYEVLRIEPVRIFGGILHNECILRLKGESGDV